MTVRQIIQEIQSLPPEEQREVSTYLQEQLAPVKSGPARYLDREKARPMIAEMLTDHAELFQKLAQ